MVNKKHEFEFEVYSSLNELNKADALLLSKARENTQLAYAPYSRFQVGAAALLTNNNFVAGSNQENASFPAGICAERSLLSTAATLYPKVPIDSMAISYNNQLGKSSSPISPCGICRQCLIEYENLVAHPIRLLLGGMDGEVYIIPKASMLLPLSFTSNDML